MANFQRVENEMIRNLDKEKIDLEKMEDKSADLLVALINGLKPKGETVHVGGVLKRKKTEQPVMVEASRPENTEDEAAILLEFPGEDKSARKLETVVHVVKSEKEVEFKLQEFLAKVTNSGSELFTKLPTGEMIFRTDVYLNQTAVQSLLDKYFVDLSNLEEREQKGFINLRQKFIQELIDQLEVLVDPVNRPDVMATGKISVEQLQVVNGIKSRLRRIIQ